MKALNYLGIAPAEGTVCENLLLICMDFRFHRRLIDVLGFAGYHEMDLLALPGSSKSLIDLESREVVLKAVSTAITVHGVKRLIIVDHIDCKAYGGSEAFASSEQEISHHTEMLNKAAIIVSAMFPDLEVVKLYAAWDYVSSIE